MKRKDFERFATKYLIPQMPGFIVKGHLIFQAPVQMVFRGFIFDSSGFSAEAFHPEAFVQPLYVPSDHITMTLGERFLGAWKFREDDKDLAGWLLESMKSVGLPWFESLGTPENIAHTVESLKSPKNHYVRQAAAYSLAWIDEDKKAMQKLIELSAMLIQMSNFQKWALNVHAEAVNLRAALFENLALAKAQLARWAEETRLKLGLPE